MWRGGSEKALRHCASCDIRHPLDELEDSQTRTCPSGHVVEPAQSGSPLGTFLIFLCAAFIAVGVVLIASGRTPGP
jgi:hypothetical protein